MSGELDSRETLDLPTHVSTRDAVARVVPGVTAVPRPISGMASIDIYCQCGLLAIRTHLARSHILSSTLNVQLTDALRKYVDERASDKDVYATPSEYIRDLIRQDMQDRAVALNVLEGLGDLRHGRFSDKSILDFKEEED